MEKERRLSDLSKSGLMQASHLESPRMRTPAGEATIGEWATKSKKGEKRMESMCEHQRERSRCKECKGSSICEHQRHRSICKECGESKSAHIKVAKHVTLE